MADDTALGTVVLGLDDFVLLDVRHVVGEDRVAGGDHRRTHGLWRLRSAGSCARPMGHADQRRGLGGTAVPAGVAQTDLAVRGAAVPDLDMDRAA